VVLDIPSRRELYYKAEDVLMDEAPIAITSHMPVYKVLSKKISGFEYIPADSLNLHTVSLG
jgi:peptide/nickel transport system substrate-binding protein